MASVAAVLGKSGPAAIGLSDGEHAIPDTSLGHADVFQPGNVLLQFGRTGRETVFLEDVSKDVDLDVFVQGSRPAFGHGVANLDEEIGERAFLPMRQEGIALDRGTTFGSDEGKVVTARTGCVELGLTAARLIDSE